MENPGSIHSKNNFWWDLLTYQANFRLIGFLSLKTGGLIQKDSKFKIFGHTRYLGTKITFKSNIFCYLILYLLLRFSRKHIFLIDLSKKFAYYYWALPKSLLSLARFLLFSVIYSTRLIVPFCMNCIRTLWSNNKGYYALIFAWIAHGIGFIYLVCRHVYTKQNPLSRVHYTRVNHTWVSILWKKRSNSKNDEMENTIEKYNPNVSNLHKIISETNYGI